MKDIEKAINNLKVAIDMEEQLRIRLIGYAPSSAYKEPEIVLDYVIERELWSLGLKEVVELCTTFPVIKDKLIARYEKSIEAQKAPQWNGDDSHKWDK